MDNSLILIVALAASVLLAGCAGSVPQKEYDYLKASCADEKQSLQTELDSANGKIASAAQRYEDCISAKQALEGKLEMKELENSMLRTEAGVLVTARQKAEEIAAYGLVLQYYDDAFGPGKVLNTYRLNRIDTQVRSLLDSQLLALWNGVRNCGGLTDCDSAKAKFTSEIQNKKGALALEIVEIVKDKNSTASG